MLLIATPKNRLNDQFVINQSVMPYRGHKKTPVKRGIGGERGIRTLEGLLALTPLAGARLRPLGHLSGVYPLKGEAESYWSWGTRVKITAKIINELR